MAPTLPDLPQPNDTQAAKMELARVPVSVRRRWAFGLWIGQGIAAIVALVAAIWKIESILLTGPTLTLTGLTLAWVIRRARSWQLLLFSLSAPLVSALGAGLIANFRWSPSDATRPITAILFAYTVGITFAFVLVYRHISKWGRSSTSEQSIAWRFSLKTMLLVMTAICVLLAIGQVEILNLNKRSDQAIFGYYSLAVLTVVAAFLIISLARTAS